MTIQENIAKHADSIGRMLRVDRAITKAEQEDLFQRFIMASLKMSSNNMRFGDFLEWALNNVDLSTNYGLPDGYQLANVWACPRH